MPGDVIQAFADEIASRDARRLETFLSEHVVARFDVAGSLVGRAAVLGFWRRLFQSYALFELHIVKTVIQGDLVLAESLYLLGPRKGGLMDIRAISIFEVEHGVITRWQDHADLSDVPQTEQELWSRLVSARW